MNKDLGQRLKALRKSRGLTQAQLAHGLCDRTALSRIESGTMGASRELIEKLGERLCAPQLVMEFSTTDTQTYDLGFAPLMELVRMRRYDEAVTVGEALFWTFSDLGALKAMRHVADILSAMPVDTGRHHTVLLSALLYQLIAHQQLADAFDVGLNLIRTAGRHDQCDTVLNVSYGLLALQPPDSIKVPLLIAIGTGHRRLENVSAAMTVYTMANNMAGAVHMRQEQARALHGLSACYLDSYQDYDKAIAAASQASQLYQQADRLYWLAQQNLAIAYLRTSRTSQGLSILERCGLFWEANHDDKAVQAVRDDMRLEA